MGAHTSYNNNYQYTMTVIKYQNGKYSISPETESPSRD